MEWVPLPQPPLIVLQIGEPRTATTLQYATIIGALALKFELLPEVELVVDFNTWDHIPASDNQQRVLIIKLHNVNLKDPDTKVGLTRLASSMHNRTLVFMTARTNETTAAAKLLHKTYGLSVTHVTTTAAVSRHGFRADWPHYKRIFGLSNAQLEALAEWLEAWSVIRVCCGLQMSDVWRLHMVPDALPSCKAFGTDDRVDDNTIRMCSSHNITATEAKLLRTPLYQTMGGRVPFLGMPSQADGPLTGQYCETCTANVRRTSGVVCRPA